MISRDGLLAVLELVGESMFFLRLLITDFVGDFHESPRDEINCGVFILHVFAYFG
jgi:hypothetical protein